MTGWSLPDRGVFGGRQYRFYSDFRDILEIFSYFSDPELPDYVKWEIALALFYQEPVAPCHRQEAMEYLRWFVAGGREDKPAPRLLDWEQDSDMIISDVNKTAGREIRALPYVHWWTFLSWFHAIGEGQLSTVVAIRSKLAKGKKLEGWEQEFYREHKDRVELKPHYTRQELHRRQQLEQLLNL